MDRRRIMLKLLSAFLYFLIFEAKLIRYEYTLFIYMIGDSDNFADATKIITNRDLLIGDIVDFSDHNLTEVFRTTHFSVVKRQFSLEFNEMNLYIEPFII